MTIPMTPNKSDSVCDCIYGDGACEKHSDSGELAKKIDELFANDDSWMSENASYFDPSMLKPKIYQLVTAHIQAERQDELKEANKFVLGANLNDASRHKWAVYFSDRSERLAQYLGEKQDAA